MSLASYLNDYLNKITLKDDDRATYLSHAQKICNELMEDLKNADSDFRKAFNGLSLSGSYLDRLKLKTPDEFDMHVELNLPFEVVPIKDPQRDGFVFLKVPGRNSHPAVANWTNGCYIDRQSMQSWIRDAFKTVFKNYNTIRVNNELYKLEYVQCGFGCAHTIVATSSSRTISFDYVPAFKYSYSSWPLPAPDVDLNVRNSYGLSLSGSYLDHLKLKTPDEFDMHVELNLPFEVVPIKDPQRDGFVFLKVPGRNSHPAVANWTNGCYIDRQSMQSWIREAFKKVFKNYNTIRVNNELYKLEYVQCGFGCAHTIVATSSSRTISFDFVPAFKYSYSSWPLPAPDVDLNVRNSFNWFAVPQQKRPADDRTFMVCAPHWEREMMSGKQNLKNVIRLMKAMRDTHYQGLPHLSSYMLKTVILLELKERSNSFWNQDLGTLYKEMWNKLDDYFRAGNLPYFLAPGCNHFDRMPPTDFKKCKETVADLNRKLQNIYYESDLKKLFLG